ncbi:glycosyltransferase family 4 protein [Pseudanabaena sp. FACHB-1998]|uniref:glycosyltransferase family 4 protein n=1 Tax=Pseudanabaena sp. FACHB-1998 TaxID=2692858 RepID=UPI00167FF49F|nr:glycosyltransferase family 4 protein [Pseudanabaena sp. FACHB-1998]MBD2175905.1 glycosyltransferase family 4 protein [Pseudanabaena sp. FACHB-1998]
MSRNHTIHLWIPELFSSKGGIQVFSGFFLQAIHNIYPHSKIGVVLKNDLENLVRQNRDRLGDTSNIQIYCTGKTPSFLKTLVFSLKLISLAIAQKPDLVIMTHLNFAPIAWFLKNILGTKYIAIAHGVEAWDIQSSILKKSLHGADRIFAVSEFTRDRLCQEQGLSPAKIEILHNTFDADAWKIAPKPQHLLTKYGLRAEQKIILTVSRLVASEQYKGYDRLLEALPMIRQHIPDVHYVIVGKGSDRDRIEKIIQQNNLQDYVTLVGFVPDEDLCDYYNLCDLFAMPSKREGFGIVYLEAFACGKPTLGGCLDGAVDALCHGALGVLINPDDPQEISEAIIKILKKENDNQLIYQPNLLRQKAISTFGFEKFQQTIANYLSKILN